MAKGEGHRDPFTHCDEMQKTKGHWYFHKVGGELEGTRLASVDPGDAQWNGFGPDRVLGCVVYPAAEVIEPGVVKHIEGNRFSLGEPDG